MNFSVRHLAALPLIAVLTLASWACGNSGDTGDELTDVQLAAIIHDLFADAFVTDGLRDGILDPIESLDGAVTFDSLAAEISDTVCIDGGTNEPQTTSGAADGNSVFSASHTFTACASGKEPNPSARVLDGETVWTGIGDSEENEDNGIVSGRGNGTVVSTLQVEWLDADVREAIGDECELTGAWRSVSSAAAVGLPIVSDFEDLNATLACGDASWLCTLAGGSCEAI